MDYGRLHPARKMLGNMVACAVICTLVLSGCAQAPAGSQPDVEPEASVESATWQPTKGELTRLDEDGYLYYLDYAKDYYSDEILQKLDDSGATRPACSAFFTHTLEGDPLTCRNYDEPHRVSAEDRTMTGLNVVVHCALPGKYESIAVADATYCAENNPLLTRGGPDVEGFSADMVDTIPYECMDGMNEKGLAVSILMVDIKEGDEPANMVAGSSIMLRRLIDNCADVDEAVSYVNTSDLTPADWQNCHFFCDRRRGQQRRHRKPQR